MNEKVNVAAVPQEKDDSGELARLMDISADKLNDEEMLFVTSSFMTTRYNWQGLRRKSWRRPP